MEDYYAQRAMNIRALRAFPRSAGLITTAVLTPVSLDPWYALGTGLAVWFALRIVNWVIAVVMPNIFDLNIGTCCAYLILPIGGWFLRWPIAFIAAIVAILRGANPGDTAIVLGGFAGLDVFMTLVLGW